MLLLKDKLLILCCIALSSSYLIAQQHTQFSNYLLNSITINPAYAGSKDGTELMATYRKQWTKIEGSPSTFSASGHSSISNSKIGISAILVHDKIGISNNLHLSLGASYRLKLNKYQLQFGLNGGVQVHNTDYSKVNTIQADDEVFTEASNSHYSPIIGTGAFMFKDDVYFGLSSPNLIQISENSENGAFRQKRHYYLSSGKVFTVSKIIKLKPSILIKITKAAPVQFDFSGTAIFDDVLGVGLSYRTHAGLVWFAQFFIKEKWTIAYAYDQMTNNLSTVDGSSHEITIIRNLYKNQQTIYSPRYF